MRLMRKFVLISVVFASLLLTACKSDSPDNVDGDETPTPVVQSQAHTPTRAPVSQDEMIETQIPEASSQSALVQIRERGVIKAGVLFNAPPLSYLADNGDIKGYEVEILTAIAEQWGVAVEFVHVTRQTRFSMLHNGEVDIVLGEVPHRREYEEFASFTDTFFFSGIYLLSTVDSSLSPSSILQSGRVGVVMGSDYENHIQDWYFEQAFTGELKTYSSLQGAIAALKASEIDGIVSQREHLLFSAVTDEQLEITGEALLVEPYAFAVRKDDFALRELFNLTFHQLVTSGDVGQIYSDNLYGSVVDQFVQYSGEPQYTFENFPVTTGAESPILQRLQSGGALRVAGLDLNTDYPQFESQPIIDGFNRAVINELARRWNIPVEEIPASTGNIGYELLATNQADLLMGVQVDLSYIGDLTFSQPYYTTALRVIHLEDVPIQNIADLSFKPTVVVSPIDISRNLVELNNGLSQIQTASTHHDGYQALLSRGVYALVGDEFILNLMSQADSRITFVPYRYRITRRSIALPVHDSDFIALVNFTLQDMAADGTLQRLHEQYFLPYIPDGEELELPEVMILPGESDYLGFGY